MRAVLAPIVCGAVLLTWWSVAGAAVNQSAGGGAPAGASAVVEGPSVIALKFHADWCGYCKAMGPVFEDLAAKFDQQPVLYLTLDQTRDNDRRQAQYLVHALGLADVWAEHGGKTGFILLVDAQTRKVIARLPHDQSLKDMGGDLLNAVGSDG